MNALKRPGRDWKTLIEHQVEEVALKSAVELVRLGEERKVLQGRKGEVEAILTEMGESEAKVRAHRTYAGYWFWYSIVTVGIAMMTAWWSVSWYQTLSWEKLLIAVTIVGLPLVGWTLFLKLAPELAPQKDLKRFSAGLGLVIVLSSLVAGTSLAAGRMVGTNFAEERANSGNQTSEDLDQAPEVRNTVERADRVKRLLAVAMVVSVIFLGIASETAAGIAVHEYTKRMTVVRTVTPLFVEHQHLEDRLVDNAELQELARRRPELLRQQRAIEEIHREAAALAEAEEAERLRAEKEARASSLGRLVWRVVIPFFVVLGIVLVLAVFAGASEVTGGTTVVLLDLSASTGPDEFTRNIRAVEGLIRRTTAGTRVVVMGVTDRSFAAPVLFHTNAPREAGQFGEHLEAWRARSVAAWRKTGEGLGPTASGSDLFGALARAVVEFTDVRGPKRLVILSDMRHVGRGVNLERPRGDVRTLILDLVRQGLVPRLDGVTVHALGAHTAGFEERQWQAVRAFWAEYFREAGATLAAFSPNRRAPEL